MPLLVETRGQVRHLVLNRPERRNALSLELLLALEAALEELQASPGPLRAVVLAGNGPIFSAGHDLGELRNCTEEQARLLFGLCSRVMLRLRRLPLPVVARVHGLATAAGCQLACAADLVVAAESASFATPGVKIGLFCTTPMVPLTRALPSKVALEMLFTGAPISAHRAYEVGLVNRVVADETLDAAVESLVGDIAAADPRTLALGKEAFYRQRELSEEAAYAAATDTMTANAIRDDARTGIAAFLDRPRKR